MIKSWVLYLSSVALNIVNIIFLPKETVEYSTVLILAFILMCTGFVLSKLEQAK